MKRKKEFWESARNNSFTYLQYYNKYVELSLCMFEWKNLPETVDARFLELSLFTEGHAVFFKDEELGYLALRCAFGGHRNVYRIPTMRYPIAVNGTHFDPLTPDNSVIIWNNLLHANSALPVEEYSRRLYEIERTLDTNIRAQKTPVLIKGSETERLSLINTYQKYDGNQPVIFADKSFDENGITVLRTDAPYLADKLYMLKTQYNNECLTYLGISNVNIQKKERLLSDEVTRNMGGVLANRYARLEPRQQACKEINKMFGLNISCEYREDTRMYDLSEFIENTNIGGENNE